MMSLPVRSSDVGPRTPRSSTFLTGEWSVGTGVTRLGGRFLSRGRVALGALHWLSWIIVSPRSVVSGGVARELDTLGVGALRLVGSASKLAALFVALPALTVIADGFITFGGWVGTTLFLGFNSRFYLEQIRTSLSTSDIATGVAKSLIFGFVIAIIASDEGLSVDRR